jgi:hypothetical protein
MNSYLLPQIIEHTKKNMAYADRIRYELIKEILLINGKLFKD